MKKQKDMAQKTRQQIKNAFRQGAWPQATDYSDMIDSFALVSELPQQEQGGSSRQQVVDVPAGEAHNGERYSVTNQLGKYPCVNVYVKRDNLLLKVDEVVVELKGTEAVLVTVRSQSIDVSQTGMIVILS